MFIAHAPGMFNPEHMEYELDREDDVYGEPSLTEMVEKAIKILQRSAQGFLLIVECNVPFTL